MEVLLSGVNKNSLLIRKTYVILPAYNEAGPLTRLIPRIVQKLTSADRPFEIIVVNDGSSDDTSRILNAFPDDNPIRELRHDINRGYGASLKTAFSWVATHASAEDAAVSLDADNTHDPGYIPSMLEKLENGFDAVTASYTMPGGHATGVPRMRYLMSSLVNFWFALIIRLSGIHTYTNGFRAYRVRAIQAVHQKYAEHLIDETGFPGGTEFFLKIAGQGGQLAEIPFDLHYEQRGDGSKIRVFTTIHKYLRLLIAGGRYARR